MIRLLPNYHLDKAAWVMCTWSHPNRHSLSKQATVMMEDQIMGVPSLVALFWGGCSLAHLVASTPLR
ncbi:hypothetical protein M8C21_007770 [Ambrosia artemisiifolia]|uniref:Uncharacterized protein n=1 Tax=Ambrosia artemisiifolia TaxID=4212 RepID=A0AAD5GKQ2_AMBAR|nr:hypothetical protein M8C21_007770 [Ambrosia artemisiifolia]